jgi:hypothetical protein
MNGIRSGDLSDAVEAIGATRLPMHVDALTGQALSVSGGEVMN